MQKANAAEREWVPLLASHLEGLFFWESAPVPGAAIAPFNCPLFPLQLSFPSTASRFIVPEKEGRFRSYSSVLCVERKIQNACDRVPCSALGSDAACRGKCISHDKKKLCGQKRYYESKRREWKKIRESITIKRPRKFLINCKPFQERGTVAERNRPWFFVLASVPQAFVRLLPRIDCVRNVCRRHTSSWCAGRGVLE